MFRTSTLDNSNGTPQFGSLSVLHIHTILIYLGHVFSTIYEGHSNSEDVSSLLHVSLVFHRILLPTAIQERERDVLCIVTAQHLVGEEFR